MGKGDDLYSLKWYKDEVEFYRYYKLQKTNILAKIIAVYVIYNKVIL